MYAFDDTVILRRKLISVPRLTFAVVLAIDIPGTDRGIFFAAV